MFGGVRQALHEDLSERYSRRSMRGKGSSLSEEQEINWELNKAFLMLPNAGKFEF